MEATLQKTLEEHKIYVEEMARIAFFFARRLGESLSVSDPGELLKKRTPLFSVALGYKDHETGWDNPDCRRVVEISEKFFFLPPREFEMKMFDEIRDLANERAEESYSSSPGMPLSKDWNAGSLKYDPPKESLPSGWCNFHIANAVAPRSIFHDPLYLPNCFMEMMDKSSREYNYDTLHTTTWLNDRPDWLALFPEEWHSNLSPGGELPGWDLGYWGQLVTARGTFNCRAGLYVREQTELKYRTRNSHCSFSNMRAHLAGLLNRPLNSRLQKIL